MNLTEQNLAAIDAFLASADASAATVAELRRLVPGVALSRCDASDVADETPFRAYERCKIFLLDGRDHCWKMTSDLSSATGLVLAAAEAKK